GYIGIALVFTSFYYMPHRPKTCSSINSLSYLLDALDGHVTRFFFFAALNMVTDRYTTTCLLVFFLFAWSRWSLAFRELIPLDLTSFFAHVCYIRHGWLWAS
ncbi:Cdipt protein, partial [Leptodontidium sp. MPI-SDFR-AT-0119]